MAILVKNYVFKTGSFPTGYQNFYILEDEWRSQDNEKTSGWLHKPQYRILGVALNKQSPTPTTWLVINETEDREFVGTANSKVKAHQKGSGYCFHAQLNCD